MRSFSLLTVLFLAIATLTSGCQLFGLDDREFEINLPEIPIGPVPFRGSILRTQLCPPPEALDDVTGDITRDIVQGFAQDLADPNKQSEVDLNEYNVDQITGVTVRSIDYDIDMNTLMKDLEPIEIYFGPLDCIPAPEEMDDVGNLDLDAAIEKGATLFGATDTIEGGTTTGGVRVAVRQDPEGAEKVREYLSQFAFATLFRTSITLEPADCQNLGGDLDVGVWIAITFFVQPF